ncbi:uroporphyrinogen-III C-methyltransferase [uncultured Ruminococcus sp.]|uniref:uroporphyrinogen-III C-methyltransferase n=1 Tax=uncultured Ruminococcus sp. TaxID=165186 RepID=UPI00266D31FB|nr:uroporphyrinogen-III C-methyltransferase [uncultured Ruminococcus sp.]
MEQGMVFLVGAGPGDPLLLTERGKQCLQTADAVVYDALASASVLNLTRPDCDLIFAGKTAGLHHKKQSETNLLLVELAQQGKKVVRLKGGDPFVFGRGGEEAQMLRKHGVPFAIVPGVSSCYSVPAYAGIPVTHRDHASSFHVITGHRKASRQEESDGAALAKLEGTLAFLMSLGNLPRIADTLIQGGKSPGTPAAVIEQGTTARQRVVTAPLAHIAQAAQDAGLHTPAMTVVGDVVSLRQELQWQERGALYGKKVLLTGTPDYVQKAALPLRKHGAEAAEVSLIYPQEPQEGTFSAIPWGDYTWLVLTSANGVELFFAGLQRDGVDLRQLLHLHFAVIGKGTAQALARHGIFADCIPPQFHSGSLAEALIPQLTAQDKVLLLRAENGSEVLSQRLEQAGVCFRTVPFYAVKSDWRKKQLLLAELKTADYVFLASSSAARTFAEMIAGEDPYAAQVISIGDATTHTAESFGIPVAKTAKQSDIDGMLQCILPPAAAEDAR